MLSGVEFHAYNELSKLSVSIRIILNADFSALHGYGFESTFSEAWLFWTYDKISKNRFDFRSGFFFFLIVEGPTSGIYLKLEGVTVPLTVWVWFQAFWQLSCNTIFCPWANKESRVRNKSGIKYWTLWWRQVKWKLIQDLTLLEVHLCISHWYTVVLWD